MPLSNKTIVHIWKGVTTWPSEATSVTAAGLQTLISSPWYLNYIHYAEDWIQPYLADPQAFNGTAEQKKLIVGGEAALWAEYIDSTNLIPRAWPRATAVAERLWLVSRRYYCILAQ